MSLFSLTSLFVVTFAWFTAAKNMDTQGDGFEATAYDGLIKSASAHMFKEKGDDGNYVFIESKTPVFSTMMKKYPD